MLKKVYTVKAVSYFQGHTHSRKKAINFFPILLRASNKKNMEENHKCDTPPQFYLLLIIVTATKEPYCKKTAPHFHPAFAINTLFFVDESSFFDLNGRRIKIKRRGLSVGDTSTSLTDGDKHREQRQQKKGAGDERA